MAASSWRTTRHHGYCAARTRPSSSTRWIRRSRLAWTSWMTMSHPVVATPRLAKRRWRLSAMARNWPKHRRPRIGFASPPVKTKTSSERQPVSSEKGYSASGSSAIWTSYPTLRRASNGSAAGFPRTKTSSIPDDRDSHPSSCYQQIELKPFPSLS